MSQPRSGKKPTGKKPTVPNDGKPPIVDDDTYTIKKLGQLPTAEDRKIDLLMDRTAEETKGTVKKVKKDDITAQELLNRRLTLRSKTKLLEAAHFIKKQTTKYRVSKLSKKQVLDLDAELENKKKEQNSAFKLVKNTAANNPDALETFRKRSPTDTVELVDKKGVNLDVPSDNLRSPGTAPAPKFNLPIEIFELAEQWWGEESNRDPSVAADIWSNANFRYSHQLPSLIQPYTGDSYENFFATHATAAKYREKGLSYGQLEYKSVYLFRNIEFDIPLKYKLVKINGNSSLGVEIKEFTEFLTVPICIPNKEFRLVNYPETDIPVELIFGLWIENFFTSAGIKDFFDKSKLPTKAFTSNDSYFRTTILLSDYIERVDQLKLLLDQSANYSASTDDCIEAFIWLLSHGYAVASPFIFLFTRNDLVLTRMTSNYTLRLLLQWPEYHELFYWYTGYYVALAEDFFEEIIELENMLKEDLKDDTEPPYWYKLYVQAGLREFDFYKKSGFRTIRGAWNNQFKKWLLYGSEMASIKCIIVTEDSATPSYQYSEDRTQICEWFGADVVWQVQMSTNILPFKVDDRVLYCIEYKNVGYMRDWLKDIPLFNENLRSFDEEISEDKDVANIVSLEYLIETFRTNGVPSWYDFRTMLQNEIKRRINNDGSFVYNMIDQMHPGIVKLIYYGLWKIQNFGMIDFGITNLARNPKTFTRSEMTEEFINELINHTQDTIDNLGPDYKDEIKNLAIPDVATKFVELSNFSTETFTDMCKYQIAVNWLTSSTSYTFTKYNYTGDQAKRIWAYYKANEKIIFMFEQLVHNIPMVTRQDVNRAHAFIKRTGKVLDFLPWDSLLSFVFPNSNMREINNFLNQSPNMAARRRGQAKRQATQTAVTAADRLQAYLPPFRKQLFESLPALGLSAQKMSDQYNHYINGLWRINPVNLYKDAIHDVPLEEYTQFDKFIGRIFTPTGLADNAINGFEMFTNWTTMDSIKVITPASQAYQRFARLDITQEANKLDVGVHYNKDDGDTRLQRIAAIIGDETQYNTIRDFIYKGIRSVVEENIGPEGKIRLQPLDLIKNSYRAYIAACKRGYYLESEWLTISKLTGNCPDSNTMRNCMAMFLLFPGLFVARAIFEHSPNFCSNSIFPGPFIPKQMFAQADKLFTSFAFVRGISGGDNDIENASVFETSFASFFNSMLKLLLSEYKTKFSTSLVPTWSCSSLLVRLVGIHKFTDPQESISLRQYELVYPTSEFLHQGLGQMYPLFLTDKDNNYYSPLPENSKAWPFIKTAASDQGYKSDAQNKLAMLGYLMYIKWLDYVGIVLDNQSGLIESYANETGVMLPTQNMTPWKDLQNTLSLDGYVTANVCNSQFPYVTNKTHTRMEDMAAGKYSDALRDFERVSKGFKLPSSMKWSLDIMKRQGLNALGGIGIKGIEAILDKNDARSAKATSKNNIRIDPVSGKVRMNTDRWDRLNDGKNIILKYKMPLTSQEIWKRIPEVRKHIDTQLAKIKEDYGINNTDEMRKIKAMLEDYLYVNPSITGGVYWKKYANILHLQELIKTGELAPLLANMASLIDFCPDMAVGLDERPVAELKGGNLVFNRLPDKEGLTSLFKGYLSDEGNEQFAKRNDITERSMFAQYPLKSFGSLVRRAAYETGTGIKTFQETGVEYPVVKLDTRKMGDEEGQYLEEAEVRKQQKELNLYSASIASSEIPTSMKDTLRSLIVKSMLGGRSYVGQNDKAVLADARQALTMNPNKNMSKIVSTYADLIPPEEDEAQYATPEMYKGIGHTVHLDGTRFGGQIAQQARHLGGLTKEANTKWREEKKAE